MSSSRFAKLVKKESLVVTASCCFAMLWFSVPSVSASYAAQMTMDKTNILSSEPFPSNPKTLVTPVSHSFIRDILKTASENKALTLWNMYPAGVRGRVFGAEGGDPLLSSSSGGWG